MLGEIIGGGSIWDGFDSESSSRLDRIEKRLGINQQCKTRKVDVSKISFALLPAYINAGTARDQAIVRKRITRGA